MNGEFDIVDRLLLFSQNDSSITVFTNRSPWAGFEEEALLDAVEQYSIGNWLD